MTAKIITKKSVRKSTKPTSRRRKSCKNRDKRRKQKIDPSDRVFYFIIRGTLMIVLGIRVYFIKEINDSESGAPE